MIGNEISTTDSSLRNQFIREIKEATGYPIEARTLDNGKFIPDVEEQYQVWLIEVHLQE